MESVLNISKDLHAIDLGGREKGNNENIMKSQQKQKQQQLPSPPVIICDAWYGFPIEKRPRKERILAVSKQIYNFLRWRLEFHALRGESNTLVVVSNEAAAAAAAESSHVIVIGKVDDVNAIQERVNHLFGLNEKGSSVDTVERSDPLAKCMYLPGMTLEDIASGQQNALFVPTPPGSDKEKEGSAVEIQTLTSHHEELEKMVYLSPDADERLDPYQAPPRIVIVGMLVDRKVQPNRSKFRAQKFNDSRSKSQQDREDDVRIQLRRLPMDDLRVIDLKDNEPLNIDTVMEIMERWWASGGERNGRALDQDHGHDSRSFADAAMRSLHSHRKRHPNRTIHGGILQSS